MNKLPAEDVTYLACIWEKTTRRQGYSLIPKIRGNNGIASI